VDCSKTSRGERTSGSPRADNNPTDVDAKSAKFGDGTTDVDAKYLILVDPVDGDGATDVRRHDRR
jgi:hypothetical protein